MKPESVNEVLQRGREENGRCIAVEGLLTFEFEQICLSHWPKAEQREGNPDLWIEPDGVLFGYNDSVLERWSGKRVVVFGIIEWPSPKWDGFDGAMGFGHFGLCPAQLRARRIDLLKSWRKAHPEVAY